MRPTVAILKANRTQRKPQTAAPPSYSGSGEGWGRLVAAIGVDLGAWAFAGHDAVFGS